MLNQIFTISIPDNLKIYIALLEPFNNILNDVTVELEKLNINMILQHYEPVLNEFYELCAYEHINDTLKFMFL
jgi:hypothetical protein